MLDKNSAPSAEGAFKAITAASECLSDKSKREAYDAYGHEASSTSGGSGPSPFGAGHGFGGFGGQHEMSPEELFNMFFMGHAGPGMRYRPSQRGTFRPDPSPEEPSHRQQGENQRPLFLLVVVMFILMMSNLFSGSPSPAYYLQPYGNYHIPRKTSVRGVSPNIPYYVDSGFDKKYTYNTDYLRSVERNVEAEFRNDLENKCYHEKQLKQKKVYAAQRRGKKEEVASIEKTPLPSCEEYMERFDRSRKTNSKRKSFDEFEL